MHLTTSLLISTLVDLGRCPEKRCQTAPRDLAISFEASTPDRPSSVVLFRWVAHRRHPSRLARGAGRRAEE